MDDAAAVLDELSQRELFTERGDLVFPSPTGGHRDDRRFRKGFYAALAAAGLGHLREKSDPFVFHDLRHTFGTIAVRVWPVPEVQLYMGHDDIKTTMRYVHYQPRHEAAQEFTATVRKMASVEIGREVGRELPTSSRT
jgi:integrase